MANWKVDLLLHQRLQSRFGVHGEACDAGFSARVTDTGHFVFGADGGRHGKFAHRVDRLANHGQFRGICAVDAHHGQSVRAWIDSYHHVAFDFEGRLGEKRVRASRLVVHAVGSGEAFATGRSGGALSEGAVCCDLHGDDGIAGGVIVYEVNGFGFCLRTGGIGSFSTALSSTCCGIFSSAVDRGSGGDGSGAYE